MSVTANEKEFLWEERYRPQTVDECILPARIINLVKENIKENQISNYLFGGHHGTGKTTLALAIANDIGCDVMVINASDESGIDTIRTKLTQFASSVSLDGKPKIAVLDEADGLTPAAQWSLRGFIEKYSKNCRFIFTCNFKNKIIPALSQSRLSPIDFEMTKEEAQQVKIQFFKRACEILRMEDVEFEKPIVAKMVEKHFPDFRRVLKEFQTYSKQTGGTIDKGILTSVRNVELNELIDYLKSKNFTKMRKWVAENATVNDCQVIYRRLYDSLDDVCEQQCIPNMILLIADYSYKSCFAVDQEINLVACLTEMMANGEWK